MLHSGWKYCRRRRVDDAKPSAAVMRTKRLPRLRLAHGLACLGLVALGAIVTGCTGRERVERPPNFIIILTDDQGYADVGVYGARGFDTPNLDRLAQDGIRFTSFYMANSACSPSRAALLTGSYPDRVGMPRVLGPRSTIGLNPDEITIAELLKSRGYATAAVGKWHLGDHPVFLPTNQGFDTYFGIPYSNDMSPDPRNNPRPHASGHPPLPLIRDTTIIEREPDQSTLTRRYTEEVIAFIETHADRPFFVYLAHTFPHVPLYASQHFRGSTEQGLYGDVISEIDASLGAILATLERLGLDQHTLIAFTSDNGPWLIFGNHSGSAGPLREGKGTTFEGGQRVPGIMRWPGQIPAGQVSNEPVTAMDFLPTLARLAGAELPADRVIDGHDIWPLLAGVPGARSPYEKFFYYRTGQLQAVRSGRWKLHVPHAYWTTVGGEIGRDGVPGSYAEVEIGFSLFDLEADIGETTDVAGQHPDVVERLLRFIEEGRRDIGDDITESVGTGARRPGQVAEPWERQMTNGSGNRRN